MLFENWYTVFYRNHGLTSIYHFNFEYKGADGITGATAIADRYCKMKHLKYIYIHPFVTDVYKALGEMPPALVTAVRK